MNPGRPLPLLLLPALRRVSRDPVWARLLARADPLPARPRGALAALAGELGLDPAAPPIAALDAEQDGARAYATDRYLRADPAHVHADATGARLLAYGAGLLDPAAIARLADAVRPLLAGHGLDLVRSGPAGWLLRVDAEPPTGLMPPPEQALGLDLAACLPRERRWRCIFNELQIELLHLVPSPLRCGRGGLEVNALWLWGSGPAPATLPKLERISSDDADLVRLALAAGATFEAVPGRPIRGGVQDWRQAWHERRPPLPAWFDTLIVRLDSGEGFLVRPWHRLRFWRRALPSGGS